MKTLFKLLLISCMLCSHVYGQKSSKLFIDGNVGINSVWITNQNAYGNMKIPYGTAFGHTVSLGIALQYELYSLDASVGNLRLGQYYSGEQYDGTSNWSINLNYLQVPVLASVKLYDDGNSIWLSAGPSFLYLLGAKQKFERKGGDPLPNPEYFKEGKYDVKERFQKFDVGFALRIKRMYKFSSSDNMFYWAFNSYFGFLDIHAKDYRIKDYLGVYKNSHNLYFGVTVGLCINTTKK
ncbi:MAG: outer membrane beta-barrel protein [Bacteroidales bacterium]|jgi:hypothetical protein